MIGNQHKLMDCEPLPSLLEVYDGGSIQSQQTRERFLGDALCSALFSQVAPEAAVEREIVLDRHSS
jgi:hypothetical protein